jgi:hypothetical protein
MHYEQTLDPRRRQAIGELSALILEHYPTATFSVEPSADDPAVTHLVATVDVDDPDAVVDLVIERVLALTIDEGVPVYVIPIRTPERIAKLRRAQPPPR